MTPTTTTKNADTQSGVDALTSAVASFETSQSKALADIARHAQAVGEELARLSERPTREELKDVQTALDKSREDHTREVGELKATLAERDGELAELRQARDQDAETIRGLKKRFRSFEIAAQSIMAGLAGDGFTPAPAVIDQEPAAAPALAPAATAEPAPEPAPAPAEPLAEAPAPVVVEDPFGLDETPAPAPAAEEAAPAGVVIPDLEESDPFKDDPARTALLAQAAGNDDPFGLPAAPAQDSAPSASEAPSAPQAGTIVDDPFAFMDLDAPAAPAVQEAPKVVPVFI